MSVSCMDLYVVYKHVRLQVYRLNVCKSQLPPGQAMPSHKIDIPDVFVAVGVRNKTAPNTQLGGIRRAPYIPTYIFYIVLRWSTGCGFYFIFFLFSRLFIYSFYFISIYFFIYSIVFKTKIYIYI
ncbi:hypothetical protein L228DRAFT_43925 [Xylona heveae TC161]|uniref:Uncharacterized protein n=1 Tax=Xylona heveae (strain CBS 132557 / TC161) TaxID=1328760 RepID=A0A164ZSW9_XYLHT|nr:hypothetical protein L228DRAFT_43925 [Xylona heveae TC161]KZF19469.1 hypothetical protein L228DRAFT_43925 [Xylona heveae TC161]